MARWAAVGIVWQIRDQLRKRIRRQMGRAPDAVATVIDSQFVKAAVTVGLASRPPRLPVRGMRTTGCT